MSAQQVIALLKPLVLVAVMALGDTQTRSADGRVMVYVPAGEFLMGSADDDADAADDEKPQHEVYLDAYWIDRTEGKTWQVYRRMTLLRPLELCSAVDLAKRPCGVDLPGLRRHFPRQLKYTPENKRASAGTPCCIMGV